MTTQSFEIARTANGEPQYILSKMLNRHGLIAGATGTGKTVSLRKLAEYCSGAGIPAFLVDVKGDLSGLSKSGEKSGKIAERMTQFNLPDDYLQSFPVRFWDAFGEKGIPLRMTVSQMGATLLSRLLQLNATQEGLMNIVFKVADDNGWLLLDFKDLRSMLQHVNDNAAEYRGKYGNVSAASVGAIQRSLLKLENEGADHIFGEPPVSLDDLMQTENGKGVINILNAERLMRSPSIFAAVLLWLLAELFNTLPECGDLDKPKFVLFFDEAHLLFDDMPNALLDQIEQVVRLIRSKGVGVWFCTQNPIDLPDTVLGQLAGRIQHALRAFTPRDQKAVKAAAETFRTNPEIKVAEVIGELAVGEALVSFLDEKGTPTPVERAFIFPPSSQLSPISESEQQQAIQSDELHRAYHQTVDNYSAYEALQETQGQPEKDEKKSPTILEGVLSGVTGQRKKTGGGLAYDVANQMAQTARRQVVGKITRAITRGILGALTKR
ncbi:MAG: DUF853 family protein [Neisseriaceae bacterium]|nr:DUF853 family protein [Neisseriaceae bacterium]